MTTQSMSLHRVLAEIKALELKLQDTYSVAFVGILGDSDEAKKAEMKAQSQSNFDSITAKIANLSALKSARNRANAITKVTIAGKEMTIDEALAAKAALPHKQALINTLQNQFTALQNQVDLNQQQIDAKVQQQIQAMYSTGTKKATEEEMTVIRKGFESTLKKSLVFADGLKDKLTKLKAEVDAFTTEVDFVLSEANATTKVDVVLI